MGMSMGEGKFSMTEISQLNVLWGKTPDDPATGHSYHPVLAHLLDVGQVALTILEHPGAGGWRKLLGTAFGWSDATVCRFLPLFAAAHDIGKISPSFQIKVDTLWNAIRRAGYAAAPKPIEKFRHEIESQAFLGGDEGWLSSALVVPAEYPRTVFLNALACTLGRHHGTMATVRTGYPEVPFAADSREESWQGPWRAARLTLLGQLAGIFEWDGCPVSCYPPNLSRMCGIVNGFLILCDWIGSDQNVFEASGPVSFENYVPVAMDRAWHAVHAHEDLFSLVKWPTDPSFSHFFPGKTARPIQVAVQEIPLATANRPSLTIIEAPMGEGKTEAALLLAARMGAVGGFYFALPTIATSEQMYGRVADFLGRHADGPLSLNLVNGRADVSEEVERAKSRFHAPDARTYAPTPDEDPEDAVRLDSWFLPRKRALLAPYGVGTIDQALMAALNVRHVTLRLWGLAGKILIVDEVHAYDTYMSRVLDRLLEWLNEIGVSVILLSATLPSARRAALLATYGATSRATSEAYPLITRTLQDGQTHLLDPPAASDRPNRRVMLLRLTKPQTTAVAGEAVSRVREGGCIAWICNTVRSAQEAYDAVRQAVESVAKGERPKIYLLHARYLLKDRIRREKLVLGRFGPPPPSSTKDRRPQRAIVIATQIVEQSLDLDFDALISELAPVDLLLQRLGRMHRHQRHRPKEFEAPGLTLMLPALDAECPDFGPTGGVYEPFILLKTLLALGGKTHITIPTEIRPLVEKVYDNAVPCEDECVRVGVSQTAMERAFTQANAKHHRLDQEAKRRLLNEPDPEEPFYEGARMEVPDDDEDNKARAVTRWSDRPNVNVVILNATDPRAERDQRADTSTARGWIKRSVTLYHAGLVNAAENETPPAAFRKTAALRNHHLITRQDGVFRWPSGAEVPRLALNPRLGVTFVDTTKDLED